MGSQGAAKGYYLRHGIDREETPMIADIEIQRAADELIERYGSSAMAVARERVAGLSGSADQPAMNIALRVLSALELRLEGKRPLS